MRTSGILGSRQRVLRASLQFGLGAILSLRFLKNRFDSKASGCLARLSSKGGLWPGFAARQTVMLCRTSLPLLQLWQWLPQSLRSRHYLPSTGKPSSPSRRSARRQLQNHYFFSLSHSVVLLPFHMLLLTDLGPPTRGPLHALGNRRSVRPVVSRHVWPRLLTQPRCETSYRVCSRSPS